MLFDILLEVTGFEGTFEMLVEQVRRHELDVIHVRLAEVAERLVAAVRPNIDLQQFTPFLSLSKLMYIKSRNLLPGYNQFEDTDLDEEAAAEQEEEATEVRERLHRQYKTFQGARDIFRALEEQNAKRLRSMQTRAGEMPGFIDEIIFLEKVTPFDVLQTMAQIERMSREDRSYHVRAAEGQRLSDRIAQVFGFIIERRGPVSFSDIVSIAPEKHEAVISFLAVVYLVGQGKINAKQKESYGEIIITAGAAG
jgi:segregation and condensation protein A